MCVSSATIFLACPKTDTSYISWIVCFSSKLKTFRVCTSRVSFDLDWTVRFPYHDFHDVTRVCFITASDHLATEMNQKQLHSSACYRGKIAHYWRSSWTSMPLTHVHLGRRWNVLCITIWTVSETWTNPFSVFRQTFYWQNHQSFLNFSHFQVYFSVWFQTFDLILYNADIVHISVYPNIKCSCATTTTYICQWIYIRILSERTRYTSTNIWYQ